MTSLRLSDIIWAFTYLGASLAVIGYNAYAHNFQLLALWVIVTAQSLALGQALNKPTNKND